MENLSRRCAIYMIMFVTVTIISFIIGLLTNSLNILMPKAGFLLLIISVIYVFIEVNDSF